MFEIPDYTGRSPEYIKSSLAFFTYHANQTMRGKNRTSALERVREKAVEYGIDLEEKKEDS
jgi:hypothetical protein